LTTDQSGLLENSPSKQKCMLTLTRYPVINTRKTLIHIQILIALQN